MIGDRIKSLRKIKGFSISELAKNADVSKSYLSQIERNMQTNPSLLFLNKIAIPLGTTIEFLLGKEHPVTTIDGRKLDEEWVELVLKAIKDGMRKEDFKEYKKYVQYENWKRAQDK